MCGVAEELSGVEDGVEHGSNGELVAWPCPAVSLVGQNLKAGPASGEVSDLAALNVVVAVVAIFGAAVGGGRGGCDAVVVELNGVRRKLDARLGAQIGGHQ